MKTIIVGLLGAIKLILDGMGITILDDNLINLLANSIAGLIVIVAVVRDNIARYKSKKAAKTSLKK